MRIALTGQPVSTRNLSAVALPKRYALPLFGADGISSVAYAADQMILTLAAAGASALAFSPWIGLGVAMVGLLVIGTTGTTLIRLLLRAIFSWCTANWVRCRRL